MIASGKSTYCEHAARKDYICVNDDSIVNLIHCNQYGKYNQKFKRLYKGIENYIITHGLDLNLDIIIDRGLCVSAKGRARFIALANSFDADCEAIIFPLDIPEVHARRRYQSDTRGYDYDYWFEVARHHFSIYSRPTLEEGFTKIHDITWEQIQSGKVI